MSSGQIDPLTFPQNWDIILIGQVASPGVCEVSEFKRAFEFDVKKGKGTLGATVTFVGRPPAKGTIKFILWQPAHFTAWDSFRPLLKYDPTKKKAQAVDIYHPSLADVDIHSVVVEEIGNIVHEGQQLYSITVSFLEYFPPPKISAVSTPTQSQSTQSNTTPGAAPPSAQDADQQEIASLLARASEP